MYTVGDFLIRIKNAYASSKKEVDLPFSKENYAIGKILVEEGYLKKIKEKGGNKKSLEAELSYKNKKPSLSKIKLVSKPSVRIYSIKKKIPKTLKGRGITLISTNLGVLTDKKAREKNVGGEIICQIY